MKREISEIEAKRVEQHQEMTDDQVFNDNVDHDHDHDDNDDHDRNHDKDDHGLVRFPNPLATGRHSWQLGNLTNHGHDGNGLDHIP